MGIEVSGMSWTMAHEVKAVEGQTKCAGHYVRPEVRRGCEQPLHGDSAYCLECYSYLVSRSGGTPVEGSLVSAIKEAALRNTIVPTDLKYRVSRYGLAIDEYQRIRERQGRKCAICDAGLKQHEGDIDHDHKCCPELPACGACVRGILCRQCNMNLGVVEKPGFLPRALRYLEQAADKR